MPSQSESLERETIYSLLSDPVREYLLCHLTTVDRTSVSEAADRIVTWSHERTVTAHEIRKRIVIQLVHNHLPRLDQYDVVDYDRSSKTLEPGSNFDELTPYVVDLEPAEMPEPS